MTKPRAWFLRGTPGNIFGVMGFAVLLGFMGCVLDAPEDQKPEGSEPEGSKNPITPNISFVTTEQNSSSISSPAITPHSRTSETWNLRVLERPKVYFAVHKAAGQNISVSGTHAAKVTQGSADSSTESGALAVFTVDAGDTLFEGGSRSFTLKVAEEGQADKTVTVNLTVEPNLTGVAVFKVLRDPTPVVPNGSAGPVGDEILERLDAKKITADGTVITDDDENPVAADTLFDAIKWVDQNAEANTDYLIRVEAREALPRIILTCNRQRNVTLRLRGYGGEKEISCLDPDQESGGNVYYNASKTDGTAGGYGSSRAFINVGEYNSANDPPDWGTLTLQLEKHITLKGFTANTNTYSVIRVNTRHSLVMLEGSKITGYTAKSTSHDLLYIHNSQIATSFSMYRDAEISGNTPNAESDKAYHLILFAREIMGNFYKERGARVINNKNETNDDRNYVTFRGKNYNFDISDSTKSYQWDMDNKTMTNP
ncbi:MAG: hypothetical protein LBP88_08870 [Treponema sp.]|nr:hypothetical protein [Treponema sp.]